MNPSVAVTQTKTATVTYKDANGNVIPAGGAVQWGISPPNAATFGTASGQSIPVTGQTATANCMLTAREPVSGFTASLAIDVAALQILITQGTIVLS